MWRTVVLVCSRQAGGYPEISQVNLTEGRILLYAPDENLFDGAAVYYSKGFFDCEQCLAVDTWVCFVDDHFNVLGAPCARRTCQGWNRCESREMHPVVNSCLRELPHQPRRQSVIAPSPVKRDIGNWEFGPYHIPIRLSGLGRSFLGFEIP